MDDEALWELCVDRLADVLEAMADGEAIDLAPDGCASLDDPHVLGALLDRSNDRFRLVAAGPKSEPQPVALTEEQAKTLLALGWEPPNPLANAGAEHHSYYAEKTIVGLESTRRAAAKLLVDTARRVYGCSSARALKISALGGEPLRAAIAHLGRALGS